MTENTPLIPEPSKPSGQGVGKTPEPSGVDLARVALRAAKEQARARGTRPSRRGRPAAAGCAPARAPTGATRWHWAPRSTGC